MNGVVVVVAVVAVVVGVVYSSPIIFIVNKNYVQSSELFSSIYIIFLVREKELTSTKPTGFTTWKSFKIYTAFVVKYGIGTIVIVN